MLLLALHYTKQLIDDCYTTNSVVTYDNENAQLIVQLEPSNNKLCGVFPPSVSVRVTFYVASGQVVFEQVFYDFAYETTRQLIIPCAAGNSVYCQSVSDSTLGMVEIESIIDITKFSAGAVVIRVSDAESCLFNQRDVIVEQDAILVNTYSTQKCALSDYTYYNARLILVYASGTREQLSNTDSTIDMHYLKFGISFQRPDAMVRHAEDRIKQVFVTVTGLKSGTALSGEFSFNSNNIVFDDSTSIGTDIFGFYESEMVTYTFSYNSSSLDPYAVGHSFFCNTIIYDQTGRSFYIYTPTTFQAVQSGTISQMCTALTTSELTRICRAVFAEVLKDPTLYTAQVEILVFSGAKLIYGTYQYIASSAQFRISCYGNMEITLYSDSAELTFTNNPESSLCDKTTLKNIIIAGFDSTDYSNPKVIHTFQDTTIQSPVKLAGLTKEQIDTFRTSTQAGIIVMFLNDPQNRQDKCFANNNSIFRLDLSKFYLEGGITMGVTCIIGIVLAIADMLLGIYCKVKRQSKKVLQTLELDL